MTISRLERDKPNVKIATRARAAEALGMDFDWANNRIVPPKNLPPEAIGDFPAGIAPSSNPRPLPTFIYPTTASGWADVPICELRLDDPEQRRILETGRFRLKIDGECMEPRYHHGQEIEFEIIRPDLYRGIELWESYVVCRCDNMSTFKAVVGIDDDGIDLAAINQRDYPGKLRVPWQEIGRMARVVGVVAPKPAAEKFKVVEPKKR